MSTLIKQTLLACSLALAAGTLCAAPAAEAKKAAAEGKKAPAKAKERAHPKATKVLKEAPDLASSEPEPDITDTTTTDFDCELGNKVTTYHNVNDDSHLALRWKKRVHRLTRVGTTTGAHRFENKNFGLIWIGIPAKGMLLDSKLNRQLANECKNAEQSKPPVETAPLAVPVAQQADAAATAPAPAPGGAATTAPAAPPAAAAMPVSTDVPAAGK